MPDRPKFAIGDYVRLTEDMAGSPFAGLTGIVRDVVYSQCVDGSTRELVDVWVWVSMVEFICGSPVGVNERLLRKARIDE